MARAQVGAHSVGTRMVTRSADEGAGAEGRQALTRSCHGPETHWQSEKPTETAVLQFCSRLARTETETECRTAAAPPPPPTAAGRQGRGAPTVSGRGIRARHPSHPPSESSAIRVIRHPSHPRRSSPRGIRGSAPKTSLTREACADRGAPPAAPAPKIGLIIRAQLEPRERG